MNVRLKETKVSMMRSPFLKKVKKHKFKPLIVLGATAVCLVIFAAAGHIVTEKNDTIESENPNTGYAMRLQHYTDFAMSDTHVKIRLNSVYDDIYLENDNAQIAYTASVYPINLKDVDIQWQTGNDVIASVDENGTVTASVPGTTDIYATMTSGDKSALTSARLNVVQPSEGIYMPTTTITLYSGGTGQILQASVSPANASNPKIKWMCKDEKVATVDDTGYVTPTGLGMTEVIATSDDGGYTGKCFVNVVNYAVKVDTVEIQNSGKDDSYLKEGESFTILAAVLPSNAKDKTLKWSSTDTKVASVSQTGVVRALKEGETYINVVSNNGKSDRLKLTVQPGENKTEETSASGTNAATANIVNGSVTYSTYDKTLEEMVNIQMGLNPPPKCDGGNSLASREQVTRWMNPSDYSSGAYKYQFFDLSRPNNTSEAELSEYLKNKGVLAGHAADFIKAANDYNISEIYLIVHACLETGNGTSKLSTGVNVNGTTVYNMYGIGAYDNSAVYSGSQKAYKEGWTDVRSAIIGGAKWISDYYVNAPEGRQNTLYKMLWNPENPGQHQYATDSEWATHQALNIEKILKNFPSAVKTYDIPVYSGAEPAVIDPD